MRPISFLSLLLVSFVGCTPPSPAQQSSAGSARTGSAWIAASASQARSAADITRVQVTVSASDMTPVVIELVKPNGAWGGLLSSLPVGDNRSFLVHGYDSSGTVRLQGQAAGVTISADQTTAVALTLQELTPPAPDANEAPLIDSLVASSTSVQAGASISLTSSAHDPNAGDSPTWAWTASAGSLSAPSAAATSWTAPTTPGPQTLTFTVTDSQGVAVSVSVAVNVVPGATGNAATDISFNLWPTVSKLSSSVSQLDVGQSTALSVLAADADGDTLSYTWTASCSGTWTHATSASASFAPSEAPSGACDNCQLTVTVQDGRGGQTTGSLALCVASASTARSPPRFTHSDQSATTISTGQAVTFDVSAVDPQSSTLTFSWSATLGTLATPATGPTTSQVVWTAPACAAATSATPTVTATVTNAFGLKATRTFEVAGLPACASGWVSVNSMSSARAGHAATLLLNGKVLVSGGTENNGGDGGLATAEVFDPATGTWTPTGSMSSARADHTATLLPDGKVLVAGGNDSRGFRLATAEVYDPATGVWTPTGSLPSDCYAHTATLLPNGKVLVAGGYSREGELATAELYDPATGTWTLTGSLPFGRRNHTATLLPNGKVLVAGGSSISDDLAAAELYDPATGTWTPTGSLRYARFQHTATLLPNGKVLVAGGDSGQSYRAQAELYDPATGTWTLTGSLSSARVSQTATLLLNGKVLIAGGYKNRSNLATTELYDVATGVWSPAASMLSGRDGHTATLLRNGNVLVSGGAGDGATAEIYRP